MGQHFISILYIYIIYKPKKNDPYGAVIYCFVSGTVKLRFTGILLMFGSKLFKILKIISENKKDPEGPFSYNYFFNVHSLRSYIHLER